MAPYRIIRFGKLTTGQTLWELVRVSDGAIIAQVTDKGIVAPEWLRQLQARLNSKAMLDEIL